MSGRTTILIAMIGGGGLMSAAAGEAPRDPNRFSMNGRFTFSVDAAFTSRTPVRDVGPPGAIATTPAQAGAIIRSYDDGFIGVDVSGNAGDATVFWSYSDASQITGGGTAGATLAFHTAPSPADQFSLRSEEAALPGFDFQYGRDLGSFELMVKGRPARAWYGFSLSFGYTELSLALRCAVTVTVTAPGRTIPDSPTPVVPRATTPVATANTRNEVEGDLYGFTVGPYLEIPLSERLIAEFCGGLAVAAANRSYTFAESVAIAGVPTTHRS